ncbi:MAG: hypothetical protein MR739_07675 [Spirochaetia bacterium]|nr:hypothetical protein [Spirochaetia bacterium]
MNRRKIILMIASLFMLSALAFAKSDTYIYDYWGEIEKSPDVYRVSHVLYADDLNLDVGLRNPQGLFCKDNFVYVIDTDNNRIIELEYTQKKQVELIRVIDSFNAPEGVINTFSSPTDLFIDEDYSYYIADQKNGRVVKLDKDLNFVFALYEPDDPTYVKGKEFLPQRVVADSKGRTYVLAKNVNKGFIKYEYDGTFTGFYGATEVMYDWTDLLWKKFATRAQREQMEAFVPTEYCNAYMDSEGFIFAVTKTFSEWDLKSDKAKPIRRLNALGSDILVKNSYYLPIGDVQWSNAAGIKDPSKFSDITVLDNEVYLALDESRGRIFAYNNQGFLLFAFGNRGNIDGFFRQPASIEHIGKDLFVLDSQNASITVFTPTEYGNLIYQATEQYSEGLYDDSSDTWSKVLEYNGNYDQAYIGIGKSYLRQNKFKEAMDCFKLKRAKKFYSKAFMYYRKEWIEANGAICIAIILVIILVPFIVKRIIAFRRELKSL